MSTPNHKRFLTIVKNLPQDYEPYGVADRDGGDCSSGCDHYVPVYNEDDIGPDMDWGVCTNAKSHRAGLLTFEHQGCGEFEKSAQA